MVNSTAQMWEVYCHTHRATGRRYIGVTTHGMMRRWQEHVQQAYQGKHSAAPSRRLLAAIREHGPDAFDHEVLETLHSIADVNAAEVKWIAHHKSNDPAHGYNLNGGGGVRQPPTIEQRFWSKVNKSGPVPAHRPELGPCWLWTARTNAKGYGTLRYERPNLPTVNLAHRVAYELAHGPYDTSLLMCHACDNPTCVRPEHLFLGTDADNMRDRVAKGRGARPITSERRLRRMASRVAAADAPPKQAFPLRTEHVKRGRRKLTDEQVLEIRRRLAAGEIAADLEREFGLSQKTISDIKTGRNWRHLPGALPPQEDHAPNIGTRGDRNGMRLHPESVSRGAANGNSKLTDERVREIKIALQNKTPMTHIAAAHSVSAATINDIKRGRIWRHVTIEAALTPQEQ